MFVPSLRYHPPRRVWGLAFSAAGEADTFAFSLQGALEALGLEEERKRRREEKREERRRKRREENKSEGKSERKQERQREEEGWSEEEWCRLLGGGQEDEEESRQVGSERAVVQARNPIYRPRHTQSLADLF